MGKLPFFSVLIPTKNRSHLVGQAIESVLFQKYRDFEIIVSDNDDSDILTRTVVKKFDDQKIKYFRTQGNLSMHDNWEFALSKAVGEYVMVLEDKQILYLDALEKIYDAAGNGKNPCITWVNDSIDNTRETPIFRKHIGSGIKTTQSTDEILKRFIKGDDVHFELPRMINSCLKRSFIDFVKYEKGLDRFFMPICPDLCAAFIQLNYLSELLHIDEALRITKRRHSNGLSMITKGETAKRFISEAGGAGAFNEYVPIKSPFLSSSVIFNDFERIKRTVKGRLRNYSISTSLYFRKCYEDIIWSESLGINMVDERKQFKDRLKENNTRLQTGLWLYSFMFSLRRVLAKLLKKIFGYNLLARLVGRKRREYHGLSDPLKLAMSPELDNRDIINRNNL
ncbi:MAG: hypothetical protein CMB97_00450 [Flavobacteriaceae bacterium]|nr:hypothetical protein [Flavobacteriaceae bacterium]